MPPVTDLESILARHPRRQESLLQVLCDIQEIHNHIPAGLDLRVAQALAIPLARVRGTIGFYALLCPEPAGRFRLLFSDNITDRMAGSEALMSNLCGKLWLEPGKVSEDGLVSVDITSCTGMCDQGPAMLANGRPITHLTHQRIAEIAGLVQAETPVADWPAEFFRVEDHIRRRDRLLNSGPMAGAALRAALARGPEGVIEQLERAGLRGRGGAGFPTGRKWRACREAPGEARYVVGNADEGEPGTFKDRVLLTRHADLLFEGMTICALTIGARQGFLYLRGEYRYLLEPLQEILTQRRAAGLLGTALQGPLRPRPQRLQAHAGHTEALPPDLRAASEIARFRTRLRPRRRPGPRPRHDRPGRCRGAYQE